MYITDKMNRHWISIWTIALTSICGVAIVLVFDDYGITWDESVQSTYGELVLRYFASGFADDSCNRYLNLRYYGPIFEVLCAALYQFEPSLKFEIRHLCIAGTALLTVVGVIRYSQLFRDPLVPIFSSLALLMFPRFIGHAFNNSKDIPFACAVVWAMLTIAQFYTLRERRTLHIGFVGLAIGLAMSARVAGVILLIYFLLVGIYCVIRGRIGSKEEYDAESVPGIVLSFLGISLIATLTMVLPWPWAHENIILNPLHALRISQDLNVNHAIRFAGETITSSAIPRDYLLKSLSITTPLILLLFALSGIAIAIIQLFKGSNRNLSVVYFATQVWLVFPLAVFLIAPPNVYDGIRHFLFLLPALAIFAGVAITRLYRKIFPHIEGRLAFLLTLSLIILPIKDIVALHPYQSTYYNELVGGVSRASKSYETDYWVSSYKEAAEWINAYAKTQGQKNLSILLAANKHSRICAGTYLNKTVNLSTIFRTGLPGKIPEQFDFYIATTRYGLNENYPSAQIVHQIGRQGAVFTVIKRN